MQRLKVGSVLLTLIVGPLLVIIFQKTADRLTTPSAHLTYYVVSGPEFSGRNGGRALYALTIQNSGDSRLTDVHGRIDFPEGVKIELATRKDLPSVTVSTDDEVVEIATPSLFPGETASVVAFATSAAGTAIRPSYSARSAEAKGELYFPARSQGALNIWTVLLGGFGALLGSVTAFGLGLRDNGSRLSTSFIVATLNERCKLLYLDPICREAAFRELRLMTVAQLVRIERKRTDHQDIKVRSGAFFKGLLLHPRLRKADREVLVAMAIECGIPASELTEVTRKRWLVVDNDVLRRLIEKHVPEQIEWL